MGASGLFQCPTTLSVLEPFPDIQPERPLSLLHATVLHCTKRKNKVELLLLCNLISLQLVLFSEKILDWDLWAGEAEKGCQGILGI